MKAFKEVAKKRGVPPAPLLTRPKLRFNDLGFLEAFETLGRSRQSGFAGPGPIAVSEVLAYCQMFEIVQLADRLRLLNLIQRMDSVYLNFVSESRPKSSK